MSKLRIGEDIKLPKGTVLAGHLSALDVFGRPCSNWVQDALFMVVTPANYLRDSRLVKENINEGNVLVVDLTHGQCFFISGNEVAVKVQSAEMRIKR